MKRDQVGPEVGPIFKRNKSIEPEYLINGKICEILKLLKIRGGIIFNHFLINLVTFKFFKEIKNLTHMEFNGCGFLVSYIKHPLSKITNESRRK